MAIRNTANQAGSSLECGEIVSKAKLKWIRTQSQLKTYLSRIFVKEGRYQHKDPRDTECIRGTAGSRLENEQELDEMMEDLTLKYSHAEAKERIKEEEAGKNVFDSIEDQNTVRVAARSVRTQRRMD